MPFIMDLLMDQRFKFIRGDRFHGLDDYASSPTLPVSTRNLEYPVQLELWGRNYPDYGLRVRSGYFFELLVKGIYGGKIKRPQELHEDEKTTSNGNPITSEIDVFSPEVCLAREVKSASRGQNVKIAYDQIAKYSVLQAGDYFEKTPEIRFEIFRHGLRGLNEYAKRPIEDLVLDHAKNIRSMASLPFSVVFAMFKHNGEFIYRYHDDRFLKLFALTSRGLNSLIAYPEETIESFELNLQT